MMKNTCTRCFKPFEEHTVSGELTCFLHGRPDGSFAEQRVWEASRFTATAPAQPFAFTRDEMGYKS